MKLLLILLGSPIWLLILISAFAVIFSLCVTLWAVFVAFLASVPTGFYCGALNIIDEKNARGCILIACSLILSGLTIFAFYGALYATKGSAILTKKAITITKNAIIGEEL